MGLNSRGNGHGRGGNVNFHSKNDHCNGWMAHQPIFTPGPGMFCTPPMGCPQNSFYNQPYGKNFHSSKNAYGKFQQKSFRRRFPPRSNDGPVVEIDLTKPWVTEEISNEEMKKQNLVSQWKMSQNDEDWSKYKAQKMKVQSLYQNAKSEYIASHPDQAFYWQGMPFLKKLYCEKCDKSFRTDDDLVIHESEHETCGRDGCDFTAHPKVISKHIKMQHDSGLYQRIGKLYTQEDITKWIEERKKHYPTRQLIEEKKAMEEEKINRGERIKEDNSKFNKSFKSRNKGYVKKDFDKKAKIKNRRQKKKKKIMPLIPAEEIPLAERKGVPAFQGIKDPSEVEPAEDVEDEKENDIDISDDEWEPETKMETAKPLINNSLGLLAAAYDSDDEDVETEQKKEEKHISDDEGSAPEEITTVCRKSPPPEEPTEKKVPEKRKILGKNIRQQKRMKSNFYERNSETRSLTLLEKLLKDEIRHERNVILQCVHYVVKNNFFKT